MKVLLKETLTRGSLAILVTGETVSTQKVAQVEQDLSTNIKNQTVNMFISAAKLHFLTCGSMEIGPLQEPDPSAQWMSCDFSNIWVRCIQEAVYN